MTSTDSSRRGIILETALEKKGRETAQVAIDSKGRTDIVYISPNQGIPVIFVPGIMGSPLIATGNNLGIWPKQGKWAWFPDSDSWMLGYGNREPFQRRQLLDPARTRALEFPADADTETLQKFCEGKFVPFEEARRRGWGSVMISSYGGILNFLEVQLRHIFYRGSIYPGTEGARPRDEKQWGDIKGYQRLSDDELRKAAGWCFPVYAVGYNWVDCNGNAAQYLKRRIDEIRKDCRERLKLKCDKVILITHSMGGLVARMCAKHNPEDILGIVHGAQPAIGAGTAYARVRGGWEANMGMSFKDQFRFGATPPEKMPKTLGGGAASALSPLLAPIKAWVGAWALGSTAQEVMAVFANGAGPLELLPNQLYGLNWLKVEYEEHGLFGKTKPLFALPKNDPYEEIYRVPNKWWRLVNPEWLVDPKEVRKIGKLEEAWADYYGKLKQARTFHHNLDTYYHPNTYAFCCVEGGRKAWHEVTWTLTPLQDMMTELWAGEPSPNTARDQMRTANDNLRGHCLLHDPSSAGPIAYTDFRTGWGKIGAPYGGGMYQATLSSHDDPGDATVPGHSGCAPKANTRFFVTMKGYEHQGAYDDQAARYVTLYSILRMAAEVPDLLP